MEVTKPRGWKPFVKDDDKLLWLGLLTRDTGIPASSRLQIRDEVVALEFDLAISLRLLRFDRKRGVETAKRTAYECAKIFSGSVDDEVLDATELHELIRQDPYADADTIIS